MAGDLLALLRTEALAVRRNLGLFVVLLVVLPGAFAAGTAVYEQTIPRDVPVGVVAADDDTGSEDLSIARSGLRPFAEPVDYEDHEAAERALQREEVYLVIHVPGELSSADGNATVTVVSDRTFVPFEEPVNETAGALETQLDDALPATVTVEQEGIDQDHSLSEYLVPTGLFGFVVLYGLIYLPYQLRSERLVLDRLQTESRLETVVGAKLLFYGAALAVPVGVVALVTAWLGYDVAALSPLTLVTVGLTFLLLAAVGLAITFLGGLSKTALFANLGIAAGVLVFSSLLFPVGFFSSAEKLLARALPTHYAAITTRSAMLRDAPATLYADYLLWLAAAAVAALLALQLSLLVYRRRR